MNGGDMFDQLNLDEPQGFLVLIFCLIVALMLKRIYLTWRYKVDPFYRYEIRRESRIELNM